ncbi:hypothetical protein [Rickettsia endosymbiont of Lasioglossum villosulum]|uniref:beta strand repeat-containing protein n=1 Tax=Rickettsia endosymbiont of Lasioglossum villosulum TaxID=3066269 RepID=UPI003132EDF5
MSSQGTNVGLLSIAGSGTITGTVNNINQIQVNGIGGTTAEFQKNVSVASVLFGNGGTADFKGSLNTDPTGNIDFGPNPNGGILQFSGTDPNGYELSSVIKNGGNGTLNVFTNLTAIEPSIGTIQTIAIGQKNAPNTLTVDVTKGLLTLLQSPSSTVTFNDPASTLGLTTSINQQVTFNNSFPGIAGGGGIVVLDSQNGTILEIQSSGGTQTLGTSAAPLEQIYVTGNVGVIGTSTNKLDVSNAKNLTIAAGGIFADATPNITSALIPQIFIGDTSGPGVYALDAVNGNFPFAAPGLAFKNDSSVLKLMTSAATGITSTIQLTGDITPPNPNTAIVEINAKNAGSTLVIDGTSNGYSIGTLALPMSKIKFTGDGTIEVTAISTPAIEVSVSKLAIAEVNSDVFFTGPATLAGVQINGDIDFQGNAANVVLASDTVNNLPALISGNIASTGTQNGTIEFMDNGTIDTVDSNGVSTNTITNIAMLKAGADNSTVTVNSGGDMSIGEIQGTGTGTIVLTQENPTINTNINETGGSAVNLTFNNGGSILGNVGSNTPVGDILVLGGTLNLGIPNSVPDSIMNGNTLYVDFNNASVVFNTSNINFPGGIAQAPITARAFIAPAPIITGGGAYFKDSDPVINNDPIGPTGPIPIYISGGDVTLTNDTINISVVNFTTPNADDLHTIAISGDLTTGTAPFGDPVNSLKSVRLLTGGKINIHSEDFYSGVTTNTNNMGTVLFDADNGFTDDLGDSTNSLKTVQFSSVEGTVKGDTYSENVTIDSGKSAIFSGYNSRSTSVPSSTVGGVTVPRSTPQFNYQTVVSSSDFQGTDNTTSAKFTNAALVQAPINNGNLTFEDDVWLQKPVTNVNTITFAPQKNALISAGVGANNIVADQTTMVFVGDNATIPAQGNITGSNVTFDLGNNTVVYDGTATPTGNLMFNVLYDTTNAGKTANTNSGNIVLANGAVLDLSKVDSIQVILTAQNNPNGIRLGSAYPLVSSKGGSIIPGAAAKLPFNVIANEKNFVRWVINDDSFILYTATADIIPTISRPSIAIHRIIHSNPNIIIPDIDIINPITNGFTPATPGTGSVTGGVFTPVDPNSQVIMLL